MHNSNTEHDSIDASHVPSTVCECVCVSVFISSVSAILNQMKNHLLVFICRITHALWINFRFRYMYGMVTCI